MRKRTIVEEKDSGKRLDAYLASYLSNEYSRSRIKRFIDNGLVLINSKAKKASYRLRARDIIELNIPDEKPTNLIPENIPLDILYEDDDLLVINKPSGMVVHPAAGNLSKTVVNALLFHTKGNLAHTDSARPGIVHRLDKDVSGLMIAAKTNFAHNFFVEQFKQRSIKREYVAFVNGIVSKDAGEIALPIGRSIRDRKKMAVKFFNSKEAFTVYRVEKRFQDYTKMNISLRTGRTHQIRVHLAHIGHPIIGDTKYGGRRFKRIALYAAKLSFIHPRTREEMIFETDIPAELSELE